MPVSVNSLFPMAAQASGGASAAPAADSLAGGGSLKSARQATGSFQSLLGAAQAVSGKPSGTANAPLPDAQATADLAAAPAADALSGDAALLPQAEFELPVQLAVSADTRPVGLGVAAKPAASAHAPAAEHIKPHVAADQPVLPELVRQAASSSESAGDQATQTVEAEGADGDQAPADAEAPATRHDAEVSDLVLPVQTNQTAPPQTAAASLQPQLAVVQPPVHDDAAAPATEAGKDKAESAVATSGKTSAKLAKAGVPAGFERTEQEPSGSRAQNVPTTAAGPADAAPDQGASSANTNLSAPLFTQTLTGTAARPSALPYAPAAQSTPQSATVAVQQGQFGNDIGVEIARALDKGSDDLLIRLDPRHMGRIDVRLSFDHDGVLRAVVSADSASSLDMLRREATDLNRALADAGVRSDGQSLRFDSRSGGQGGGQNGGQRWQGEQGRQAGLQSPGGGLSDGFGGSDDPIYRPLRSSGHVDLMA